MSMRDPDSFAPLQRGQRVRCALPHCGAGIVVAIHGEQSPASCRSMLGGVGVMGGSAEFDVVWRNGNRSARVSEALIRSSVQWTLIDEVAGEAEITEAEALAEQTRREKEEAKSRQARAFEAAKVELANDPELTGFKRADQGNEYSTKVAAANLRKLLKLRFPGVTFSVRMDRSVSELRVAWTDGPTEGEVNAQASRFKRGQFDSMTDCYEYTRTPWVELFGGANYVSCSRAVSNELMARVVHEKLSTMAA